MKKPGEEMKNGKGQGAGRGRESRAEREARLAEALRANLRRRKAQLRARSAGRADDLRGAEGPGEGGNSEEG